MIINNIKNWTELSRGYYRYVVAAKVAYEIIITYWPSPDDTNLLTFAWGQLAIAGIWTDGSGWVFDRDIIGEGYVEFLLELAEEDYKEMEKN